MTFSLSPFLYLKMETTSSMVLGRDRGIYALFHGEPLRNSVSGKAVGLASAAARR